MRKKEWNDGVRLGRRRGGGTSRGGGGLTWRDGAAAAVAAVADELSAASAEAKGFGAELGWGGARAGVEID